MVSFKSLADPAIRLTFRGRVVAVIGVVVLAALLVGGLVVGTGGEPAVAVDPSDLDAAVADGPPSVQEAREFFEETVVPVEGETDEPVFFDGTIAADVAIAMEETAAEVAPVGTSQVLDALEGVPLPDRPGVSHDDDGDDELPGVCAWDRAVIAELFGTERIAIGPDGTFGDVDNCVYETPSFFHVLTVLDVGSEPDLTGMARVDSVEIPMWAAVEPSDGSVSVVIDDGRWLVVSFRSKIPRANPVADVVEALTHTR